MSKEPSVVVIRKIFSDIFYHHQAVIQKTTIKIFNPSMLLSVDKKTNYFLDVDNQSFVLYLGDEEKYWTFTELQAIEFSLQDTRDKRLEFLLTVDFAIDPEKLIGGEIYVVVVQIKDEWMLELELDLDLGFNRKQIDEIIQHVKEQALYHTEISIIYEKLSKRKVTELKRETQHILQRRSNIEQEIFTPEVMKYIMGKKRQIKRPPLYLSRKEQDEVYNSLGKVERINKRRKRELLHEKKREEEPSADVLEFEDPIDEEDKWYTW